MAGGWVLAGGCSGINVSTGPHGIDIVAGFRSANEACAPPGVSRNVTFTLAPITTTGSTGVGTAQTTGCTLPQYAERTTDPDLGVTRYVCRCRASAGNLKAGTWQVTMQGAAGAAFCVGPVSEQGANATIESGLCTM